MISYRCPVCGAPLVPHTEEKRFVCENPQGKAHCFDVARQGYVNLLLPQKKGANLPGDSKMMVNARTDFLDKDYYKPFSDALNRICAALLAERGTGAPACAEADPVGAAGTAPTSAPAAFCIADAGCGEGYYTKNLAAHLPEASVCGFDLSRDAVAHAASSARLRGLSNAAFGVASLFEMPLCDASCDGVVCLFAPVAEAEFARILKPGGFLVLGVPGEEHLFGLKKAVYDRPYPNELRRDALPLFDFVRAERVEYNMHLACGDDIRNLFRMTPYYWKTSEQDFAKLSALDTLDTQAVFDLLVYRIK